MLLLFLGSLLACGSSNQITIKQDALDPNPQEPYSSAYLPKREVQLKAGQDVLSWHSLYSEQCAQSLVENNRLLKSFGYRIDPDSFLLSKERALLNDVFWNACSLVSVSKSGHDFVLEINLREDEFLYPKILSKEGVQDFERRTSQDCRRSLPVYLGDEWAFVENCLKKDDIQISVYAGNDILFTEIVKDIFGNRVTRLWSFDGHWAIEYRDIAPASHAITQGHIVLDGQNLNQTRNYQSTFEFALLNNRPFYFFQKDDRFGISYDGQELPGRYDDIYHYGCCDDGFFNPSASLKKVSFFALQNDQWYHFRVSVP